MRLIKIYRFTSSVSQLSLRFETSIPSDFLKGFLKPIVYQVIYVLLLFIVTVKVEEWRVSWVLLWSWSPLIHRCCTSLIYRVGFITYCISYFRITTILVVSGHIVCTTRECTRELGPPCCFFHNHYGGFIAAEFNRVEARCREHSIRPICWIIEQYHQEGVLHKVSVWISKQNMRRYRST